MKKNGFRSAATRSGRGAGLLVGILSLALGATSLPAQSVYTGTLADLVASGGTLTVDDKIFSDFSYQMSGLTSFDPTQITVTASLSGGIDYLTWGGNMSFTASDTATADLKLNYVVTATVGAIDMIDQAYTGSAQNGYLAVDETAAINSFGGTVVGSSHLTGLIPSNPPSYSNDNLNIVPPQTPLYVTKDIGFAVSSGGGFVTVSQVAQSFHQVPEPNTLLLGSLAGGLLFFLKMRRQSRHE